MRIKPISVSKSTRVAVVLVGGLLGALVISPPVWAGKKLQGRWQFNITIPESHGSDTVRTFPVTVDVSPRGDSLQGRLMITDGGGRAVGGVWRQVGKKISIAYELPCSSGEQCGSLVLLGKIKEGGVKIKNGDVIVMWDTANEQNHALYDTSNGSFSGERLE